MGRQIHKSHYRVAAFGTKLHLRASTSATGAGTIARRITPALPLALLRRQALLLSLRHLSRLLELLHTHAEPLHLAHQAIQCAGDRIRNIAGRRPIGHKSLFAPEGLLLNRAPWYAHHRHPLG